MISATDLPTRDERQRALAAVPWQPASRQLSGKTFGLLRDNSAELIDIAVGTIHARAALVALQEGADTVFQAGLDIVDGTLSETVLARIEVRDPLGLGEALSDGEDPHRLAKRALRVRVEDAAVRVAAAGNHLVNAHLRLAWEANAATKDEVIRCGFDPDSNRFDNWADADKMIRGLKEVRASRSSVLPSFALQPAFDAYVEDRDVKETRWMRHRIVHRDRASYADAPAIGRASLWTGTSFRVTFPRPAVQQAGTEPSLEDARDQVSRAARATLSYGEAIWDMAIRWLRTVDVEVDWTPGEVQIRVEVQPGQSGPRRPREKRDPGPFLGQ